MPHAELQRQHHRVPIFRVGNDLAIHVIGGLLVLLAITALSVYKVQTLGPTRCWQRKQQERRLEPPISRHSVGVNAASGPGNDMTGGIVSRGLRIYLAACVGAFVAMVHISMYLTGHGFHHGH